MCVCVDVYLRAVQVCLCVCVCVSLCVCVCVCITSNTCTIMAMGSAILLLLLLLLQCVADGGTIKVALIAATTHTLAACCCAQKHTPHTLKQDSNKPLLEALLLNTGKRKRKRTHTTAKRLKQLPVDETRGAKERSRKNTHRGQCRSRPCFAASFTASRYTLL